MASHFSRLDQEKHTPKDLITVECQCNLYSLKATSQGLADNDFIIFQASENLDLSKFIECKQF